MRKIANILTNKKFDGGNFFNVVQDKSELLEGMPTLVIGWDFTKENYPSANIIEWEIGNDVFWTFGNREKRSEYEDRINKFNRICIDRLVKKINYIPINTLTATLEERTQLNELIGGDVKKKIYIANDMVYIYFPDEESVRGIYLQDIKYKGKSVKEFLSKVYKSKNAEIISAKLSDSVPDYMLDVLKNRLYLVPAILYND